MDIYVGSGNGYEPSGCISHTVTEQGKGTVTVESPANSIVVPFFQASKANAIYKGSTLQNSSLRLLAVIKS